MRPKAPPPFHHPPAILGFAKAFSLVEVVIAIGLVSFSMLTLVGSLSVGLGTMNSVAAQQFEGMIAERLRGDLQQLSLVAIQNLDGQTRLYSHEGLEVSLPQDAYFAVALEVVDPVVAGAPPGFGTSSKDVRATLEFPLSAPPANRQKRIFSLLAAAQGGT